MDSQHSGLGLQAHCGSWAQRWEDGRLFSLPALLICICIFSSTACLWFCVVRRFGWRRVSLLSWVPPHSILKFVSAHVVSWWDDVSQTFLCHLNSWWARGKPQKACVSGCKSEPSIVLGQQSMSALRLKQSVGLLYLVPQKCAVRCVVSTCPHRIPRLWLKFFRVPSSYMLSVPLRRT